MTRRLDRLKPLFVLYPLLIWACEALNSALWVKVCVAGLGLLAVVVQLRSPRIVLAAGAVILASTYFFDTFHYERIYPFAMSASFFCWFAFFQTDGRRLSDFASRFVTVPPEKKTRLDKTVPLWSVGLAINTLILLVFLFGLPTSWWLLYSSLLSYVFLGVLFLMTAVVVHENALGRVKEYGAKVVYVLNHSYNFSIFGLMCITFIPIVAVLGVVLKPFPHRRQRIVQWVSHEAFRFVRFHTRLFKLIDMRFVDHAGGDVAPILMCNHLCMFDVVAIFSQFKYCYTFVQTKFLANPLLKPIVLSSGYIPVKSGDTMQNSDAYEKARNLISLGERFVVFPEGTRSSDGKLGKLQNGGFRLAAETGRDISPIFITLDRPFLNKSRIYRYGKGAVCFRAHIMPRIKVEGEGRSSMLDLKREFMKRYEEFFALPHAAREY
ncbi:MAG: 1-acyl-sn-glycerol-3-phosphate acyltransferase [Oligoflexales bacterium]